jgi:hypothetical protein
MPLTAVGVSNVGRMQASVTAPLWSVTLRSKLDSRNFPSALLEGLLLLIAICVRFEWLDCSGVRYEGEKGMNRR